MTSKPEVIGSSVGLVPLNALVLTGLANFRVVVGNPEVTRDWFSKLESVASRLPSLLF
jgi:hypothetical protein